MTLIRDSWRGIQEIERPKRPTLDVGRAVRKAEARRAARMR
jgi:hypothetical protein